MKTKKAYDCITRCTISADTDEDRDSEIHSFIVQTRKREDGRFAVDDVKIKRWKDFYAWISGIDV